jgi:hypothetical protein
MQAKKRYLPGLLILTLAISTLLIVVAVRAAEAAARPPSEGVATHTVTPTSTPTCNTAWRGVPSPNASSQPNYLTAIDALAPDDVWAVGYYTGTGRYLTLTLHWDGQEWSIIPSPNPGENSHFLSAVEMIAPNDVWAVGSFDNHPIHNTRHLLTMHWDGSEWSVVPNPDPGGNYNNFLTGVAAVSSDDVWAVGFWRRYSPQGLILHWDGLEWAQVSNPVSGTWDSMNAIEVVSENDIWAVGYTSPDTSYIWHWDGTVWSAVPSPNAGPLNAVDAIASNDVWAAGNHGVVLRWNGAAWNVVSNPNIGAVYGVAALAPDDVWAVGASIAHWNGNGWTTMPTPATGALRSISALTATNIWAAGSYTIGSINRTLINRYSYGCTTPTPVSTASTATPSPTRPPLTCYTLQDSITNSDPVQIGMLASSLTPSPCNFDGLPCPGVADTTPRHYKVYRSHFPFGSFSSACLTVRIDANGCPGNLFSAAYISGYNPNNICSGLRGATGDVVSGSASYQFVVYRGFDFAIVVHEVGPNTGCSNYTLTVSTDTVCNLTTRTPTPSLTPTSTAPTQSPTRTPTSTSQTPSASATGTASNTPRPPTQTPGGPTATPIPTGTTAPPTSTPNIGTPCALTFTDVPPEHPFYTWIRCLACQGIVSGYAGGTFRPGGDVTRGQIAKVVSNASGFNDDPGTQVFEDVDSSHPFYSWINRLASREYMGGYPCGGEVEPCNAPGNLPYFRPLADVTRGQLSKIVSNAAGAGGTPTGQFYADVPPSNPFYVWVERLTARGVMGGYPCGSSPGEPCDAGNKPYFRWAADITRGQASKIVTNTFFPGCEVLAGE